MSITVFSIIVSILWFDAFILLSASLRRKTGVLLQFSLFPLLILCVFSIVRVILPIEFSYTTVLRSYDYMPILQKMLQNQFVLFGFEIRIAWMLVIFSTVVSLILLVRLFHNVYKSNLKIRAFYSTEDDRAKTILQSIQSKSKGHKECSVYIVPEITSPIVTGLFHPIILLPEEVYDLSDKQLKYILRHEFCHLESKDLWTKLLIHILCCVMWWNPPIYLLRKNFEQVLELNCDQRVTRKMTEHERLEYLETILEILKQNHNRKNHFLHDYMGVNFIGINQADSTTQRFQMVYDYKNNLSTWKSNCVVIVTMSMLFFASYSYVVQPYMENPEIDSENTFIITPENSYLIPTENGEYILYVNGEQLDILRQEDINDPSLKMLPIINNVKGEKNESKTK